MSEDWDFAPMTGFRFLAAFHVLLLHEHVDRWPGAPVIVNTLLDRSAAVSFFFLVSGFIMVHVYRTYPFHEQGPASFLVSRLSRVYPLYLIGLALFLPLYVVRALEQYDVGVVGAIQGILVNVFLLQSWFTEPQWFVNRPGWTVSTAFFFYLTFPYVLRVLRRMPTWAIALTGVGLFALGQALVWLFEHRIGIEGHDIEVLHKNPLVRWPEFGMGMVTGMLFWRGLKDHRWLASPWTLPMAGVAAILLFVFLPRPWDNHVHNGLLMPLFAAVLLSSILSKTPFHGILGSGIVHRLGKASFTFYILHLPVANYLSGLFYIATGLAVGDIAGGWTPRLSTDLAWNSAFIALDLVVLVPLSFFVYERIEEPTRGRIKAWWKERERRMPRDPRVVP